MAHTCNTSYSGGRDQEDHSLKPIWANSLRPYLEKKSPSQKRAGGVAQDVCSSPRIGKQNKTKQNKNMCVCISIS
jgi:hypothetical protein